MSTKKYIVFCIIFLMAIPCKVILAQDLESDTAVQSELDIKYDSILSKAAASLTASAYQESIHYYRQASELKPTEKYPYTMILYVQDLAAKQKRADDLKRKAQIKNDLIKANQAIVDQNWSSAKILFNEILALHPDKTDEEYAKAKVEAIDLELQRIAARTPVKEEPKVVFVPKTRREAREQRKLEKRNAILASARNNEVTQQPVQTKEIPQKPGQTTTPPVAKAVEQKPVQSSTNNGAVTSSPVKQMQQKPVQATTPPAAKETLQKPVQSSTNNVAVTPPVKEMQQKPVQTTTPPVAKETSQKPVQSSTNNVAVTPPVKEMQQKPVQTTTPPVAKETSQKPVQSSTNNGALTPPVKEIQQKPVQTTTPPVAKETSQKPVQTPATSTNNGTVTSSSVRVQPKPVQASPPGGLPVAKHSVTETPSLKPAQTAKNVPASPSVNQIQQPKQTTTLAQNEPVAKLPERPADASQLKLSDSSEYVKFTCQDISFIGSNAYIKVLIQNYSPTAEFLTDTLHVSIIKNNGTVKKLDQRFVSNFPVIQPLKESVLVSFSDASAGIEPDDIFIIEMRDRMRKTKLTVQVPWSLYTQSKNF